MCILFLTIKVRVIPMRTLTIPWYIVHEIKVLMTFFRPNQYFLISHVVVSEIMSMPNAR